MKKVFLLIVLGASGIGGYYALTGRLPWATQSAEDLQVSDLREEFLVIRQQWKQVGRAGTLGMDTSTITDVPVEKLQRLEASLAILLPKLKSPEARMKAETLRQDLAVLRSDMR